MYIRGICEDGLVDKSACSEIISNEFISSPPSQEGLAECAYIPSTGSQRQADSENVLKPEAMFTSRHLYWPALSILTGNTPSAATMSMSCVHLLCYLTFNLSFSFFVLIPKDQSLPPSLPPSLPLSLLLLSPPLSKPPMWALLYGMTLSCHF